tara:strand:+ start:436 stop:738 length:303 start_codon:yes stop_codon:yes gene_type:complete
MELNDYIIIGLCVALAVSVFFSLKFGMIILRMQDAIEESLDRLDESYASITNTLQTPLFFDNNEVKKVLSDIEQARNSVLYVAGQMASIEESEEDDEETT